MTYLHKAKILESFFGYILVDKTVTHLPVLFQVFFGYRLKVTACLLAPLH